MNSLHNQQFSNLIHSHCTHVTIECDIEHDVQAEEQAFLQAGWRSPAVVRHLRRVEGGVGRGAYGGECEKRGDGELEDPRVGLGAPERRRRSVFVKMARQINYARERRHRRDVQCHLYTCSRRQCTQLSKGNERAYHKWQGSPTPASI